MPNQFWSLSPQEIVDFINAHNRSLQMEYKTRVIEMLNLAECIAYNIGRNFSGEGERLYPWDVASDLFIEEKMEKDRADMELYRLRWLNQMNKIGGE